MAPISKEVANEPIAEDPEREISLTDGQQRHHGAKVDSSGSEEAVAADGGEQKMAEEGKGKGNSEGDTAVRFAASVDCRMHQVALHRR